MIPGIADSATETHVGADRGACLADRAGHIVASDAVVAKWMSGGDHFAAPSLADVVEAPELLATLELAFSGDEARRWQGQMRVGDADGTPVVITMRRLEGTFGQVVLVELQLQASVAVRHDALTGLPDRTAIGQTVESWRQEGFGSRRPFAVLFLDLDDFKQINDRHGHAAGDRVLAELASRWLRCVREGDLVARYGGDEFVLLIRDVARPADIEPVIWRLKSATEAPIALACDTDVQLSATIGVAVAESADVDVMDLIAAADRDMYAHKRRLPR